jgi:pimeloyl-ACP methyl ester carboxylesterase
MGVETGFLRVNGSRVYYEDAGAGDCLILIHGFACDTRVWDDQFDAFARTHRVIRYDLPAFGRSDPPTGSYSTLDDLDLMMGALGVETAWIVGLSVGGGLAVEFALAHPERVRGLVLASTTLRRYPYSDEYVQLFLSYRRIARREGLEAARRDLLSSPLLKRLSENPALVQRAKAIVGNYNGFHWLYPDPHRVFYPPAIERLAEITVPTQVIVGQHDLADLHGVAERLATGIAHAETVVMPGAGHMVNVEDPERFNRTVLDFVRRGGQPKRSQAPTRATGRANIQGAHRRTSRA